MDGAPADEEGQDGYADEEPVPANDFLAPWGDDE